MIGCICNIQIISLNCQVKLLVDIVLKIYFIIIYIIKVDYTMAAKFSKYFTYKTVSYEEKLASDERLCWVINITPVLS